MSTPPYAANWVGTTGSWQTASNWSIYNPATSTYGPGIPDAENSVSLSGSNPFTVGFPKSDEIYSLSGLSTATLDISSGTLTVDNGGSFGGTLNVSANGTLSEGAGSTLAIASGTYKGALAGAGDIEFIGGTDTVDTTNITVATWELGVAANGTGTTTVLDTSVTYAGDFLEDDYNGNNATLELKGHGLTLTGTATLDGTISGPGTVTVDGTAAELSGYAGDTVVGGAVLAIASGATVTQEGNVSLGNATSAGTLSIKSGGVYDITSTSTLGGATLAEAIVTNAGLIDISGDTTATINAKFKNTGTGTLTIEAGSTFSQFFGNATLAGTINGGGELFIGPATAVIDTAKITVGTLDLSGNAEAGSDTTLDVNLSYAGNFNFTDEFSTLDLNGKTLTLSGKTDTLFGGNIEGGGTLKVTGIAQITTTVGGFGDPGSTIEDDGTLHQTGNFDLSSGTLAIEANKSYAILAASNIAGSGTITNAGNFVDNSGGGTSGVSGNFTSTGQVIVTVNDTLDLNSGTEDLMGSITGAGVLQLGSDAQATIDTSTLSVHEIDINGGNGGGTTTLDESLTYGGIFDFNNGFGTLDLDGKTLTLSGNSNELLGGNIIDGGRIDITGAAQIAVSVGGGGAKGATIVDDGSLTQVGNVNLNGVLDVDAGDSYTISTASNINNGGAATISNKGTFTDATVGGTSNVSGKFTNSGTLTVDSTDTLVLDGTDVLDGTINGSGVLDLGFGASVTLDPTSLTVSEIDITGNFTTVTLGKSLTYAGTFEFSDQFGTLDLGGKTLILTGTSDFSTGVVDDGNLVFDGGTASISENLGATSIKLESSATFDVTNNETYSGTFTDSASTVSIASGDTLDLSGTSTLAGPVTGAGTLELGGGTASLDSAISSAGLTIAGTDTTLNATLTYAGIFDESAGTLNLDDHNFTITGTSTFSGGTVTGAGDIVLKNNSTLDNLTLDGTASLLLYATLDENGSLTLGDSSGGTGSLNVTKSSTFDFVGDGSILTGSAGGKVTNVGTLEKTGGTNTSTIEASLANTGSVGVSSGTLDLQGTVSGKGNLSIDGAATMQFDNSVGSQQALTFTGSGGEAIFNSPATFAGTINGFASGDELEIASSFTYDGFSENAQGTQGTLTFSDGQTIATLILNGDFQSSGFTATTNANGTMITYASEGDSNAAAHSLLLGSTHHTG